MPSAQSASILASPVFMLPVIFLIFYFIVIRPQKKQEKERQKMISGLNKNDEIITSGGIHGTIVNVKEKTVVIRVDDNAKLEIEKSSVGVIKKSQEIK